MKSPKSPGTFPQSDAYRLQKLMLATPVALAAASAASVAHAGVVYFDISDQVVTGPSGTLTIGNINLSGGGSYDFSWTAPTFLLDFVGGNSEKPRLRDASSSIQFAANSGIYGEGLQLFADGDTIDSASATWGNYKYFDSQFAIDGSWQNGATGFVGLRIVNGSDYNYGWMGVSFDDTNNQLTITDFAFESTLNTAIEAGAGASAIPEPATSTLLLAMGAAGVAAYRRRKARAA